MNIGSTSGSSFVVPTQAMEQGTDQIKGAVHQIVSSATTERPVEEGGSVSEGMVDLQQGKQLVGAASRLIEAAESRLGTLVNTQA